MRDHVSDAGLAVEVQRGELHDERETVSFRLTCNSFKVFLNNNQLSDQFKPHISGKIEPLVILGRGQAENRISSEMSVQ